MVPFKERDLLKQLQAPVRHVLPAVLLVAAPAAVAAQQAAPAAAQPQQQEHVVRRGDTLWDLARTYLNNPFRWPLIFEANRDVVEDPHWIYPAERLIIPPLLQRAEPPVAVVATELPVAWQPAPAAQEAQPTVIATVDVRRPVVSAAEYVKLPWISGAPEANLSGRIQGKADPATESDRIAPALYPNERVHVALSGAVSAGDSLLVVRPGRRIGPWGAVVQPLAVLRVESVSGGTATARLVAQFGDARVGDAVMPMAAVPALDTGTAEAVDGGVQAELLEFLVPQPLYGTTDLAFLSVGESDGVGIGDEFAVYVPAASDGPAEQVAVVRVVKAGDRTSTARVLSVNSVALRDGLPVRMIRKMP